MLVKKGANPVYKDQDENTPLHYASEFGSIDIIVYFIKELEIDPFVKNKFGYIASDIAQNLQVR